MVDSRAFNGETVIYGTTFGAGVKTTAARGAGKWAFCLLKATEILSQGRSVWIKLPPHRSVESLKQELANLRLLPVQAAGEKYEKKKFAGKTWEVPAPFFGGYSFAETVGLWLESSLEPAAALLSPFISTEGFSFTPPEFVDLRERLQRAIRRYERLPGVSRGLEDLNTGFFRHRSLEESRDFITAHLDKYLTAGDALHHDFLLAINHHTRAVAVSRRAELRDAAEVLEKLGEGLETVRPLAGRSRRKAFRQLAREYRDYQEKYSFARAVEPVEEVSGLAEVLVMERQQLRLARQNMPRELQASGLALSALTVNPRQGSATALKALENRLSELVRAVNEAGLYQLPVGGTEAATTPRQLQQLESLLDRLRNTRHHLAELDLFYERRHFWYAQPAHLRRLLAPLLDLPTNEWEDAFASWYFERCLEREEFPWRYHTDVAGLAGYFAAWENDGLAGHFASFRPGDHLHLLKSTDDWPHRTEPGDLLVSLTGKEDLPENCHCQQLWLAPLHDETARHYAVAGRREPNLLFTQDFLPQTPPHWRARAVDVAPLTAGADRILIQPAGAEWLPLEEWQGEATTSLNCYFPAELPPREATVLLERWEFLISGPTEIFFFHGWSPAAITQALLSDGFNAEFLCAALLRAAEAAETEPFHQADLVALGREVRLRCGLPSPAPHPLAREFGRLLRDRLPGYFFEDHQPWRDTFLPLVVTAPDGRKTVLAPNGRLPGYADTLSEARRQGELTKAGFGLISLPADRIWADAGQVLEEVTLALGREAGTALTN